MAEVRRGELQAAFERALLRLAAKKMRAAADLIDGSDLPSDEALTDAGVLCGDAGSLVEAVYDDRLAVDDEDEDRGELRA